MWKHVSLHQCYDINLIQWKRNSCLLCFAFHQRKAPFFPLQRASQNTLALPTLQLEEGVDSSTDSSHHLLTCWLAKFWVAPTTCLQNCPWVLFRAFLFQDSSQKPPWQRLAQAWVPHSPPMPAHQASHRQGCPCALGHLTGQETLIHSVML